MVDDAATSITIEGRLLSCSAANSRSGNLPRPRAIMAMARLALLQCSKSVQSQQPAEGDAQIEQWVDLQRRGGGDLQGLGLGQAGDEGGFPCSQADERRVVRASQYQKIGAS